MRSVGAAGWSQHGYFGLHAQTFGNPDGASSGGGAWTGISQNPNYGPGTPGGAPQPGGGDGDALPPPARRDGGKNKNGPNQGGGGGSPPPVGLVWTNRGQITTGGAAFIAIANNAEGDTVAVDENGNAYLSVTGGTEWALQELPISPIALERTPCSMLFGSGGLLLATGASSILYQSADAGESWTTVFPPSSNGYVVLGTDGHGNWVALEFTSNSTEYAHSNDNGITWSQAGNVTTIGGGQAPYPCLWTGAEFVFAAFDPGTFNGEICASADRLNWTVTANTNNDEYGPLAFVDATYYAGSTNTPVVYKAATIAELAASADPITTPLPGDFVTIIQYAAPNWFAFDDQGNVANSNSGFTVWALGTQNFLAGERVVGVCFDPIHNTVIAAGTSGSICTYP